MTLKEELSQSRREAIVAKAELEASADKEVREMIPKCIFPILRIMHKEHPIEKELSITIKDCTTLYFVPGLSMNGVNYRDYYKGALLSQYLIPAIFRVGKEFDLDVKPVPKSGNNCIVTMTLDD